MKMIKKDSIVTNLLAVGLFCLLLQGAAAQLLNNGNFESWGTVTGTPPAGTPTGWSIGSSANAPYQTGGLVSGSSYAAFVRPGTSDVLQQTLASGPTNFKLDFVFAALDPASATNRSFNLVLYEGTSSSNKSVINLRTVQGSSAGLLTLQAYSGSAWVDLVTDAFGASVYNGASNAFTTLNAYNFSLSLDLTATTPTYSISYGLVGSGLTTITKNVFASALDSTALYNVAFVGSGSSVGYAIDNVVLNAVPEPSSWQLLGLTTFGMAGLLWRRWFSVEMLG